jgi:hypothetical protein
MPPVFVVAALHALAIPEFGLQGYLTKLKYEARAAIWFSDNWLAMCGIGGPAAAWYPWPHCSNRLFK